MNHVEPSVCILGDWVRGVEWGSARLLFKDHYCGQILVIF